MYQHDLYEQTMTTDPEVLTFNVAFGQVLSYSWDGADSLDDPWCSLVGQVQRTLGPYYAGRRLLTYRQLAPKLTETVFEGGFSVVTNWSSSASATVGGQVIAPFGFLARAADGRVLAATFGSAWNGVTFPGAR
jgi:hypothetical protein